MLFCCCCCCFFLLTSLSVRENIFLQLPIEFFLVALYVQLILSVFCFFLILTRRASFSNFKRSLDLFRSTLFLSWICIAPQYFEFFCFCARYVIMIFYDVFVHLIEQCAQCKQIDFFNQLRDIVVVFVWEHIHFNAMYASHVEYFVNPPINSSNWWYWV